MSINLTEKMCLYSRILAEQQKELRSLLPANLAVQKKRGKVLNSLWDPSDEDAVIGHSAPKPPLEIPSPNRLYQATLLQYETVTKRAF